MTVWSGSFATDWWPQLVIDHQQVTDLIWCAALGKYVGVGENGLIITSITGGTYGLNEQEWFIHQPAADYEGDFQSIVWFDKASMLIAVGSDGMVQFSTDAETWSSTGLEVSLFGSSTLYGIACSPDEAVLVGADGVVARTTDGMDWDLETPDPDGAAADWTDIVWSGTYFMGYYIDGAQSSPTGGTWTLRTNAESIHFAGYADGLFVGSCTTIANKLYTGPDGWTWTLQPWIGENAYPQRPRKVGSRWIVPSIRASVGAEPIFMVRPPTLDFSAEFTPAFTEEQWAEVFWPNMGPPGEGDIPVAIHGAFHDLYRQVVAAGHDSQIVIAGGEVSHDIFLVSGTFTPYNLVVNTGTVQPVSAAVDGGYLIQIFDTFDLGAEYEVQVDTTSGPLCLSGIPGKPTSIVPFSPTELRCYTPQLSEGMHSLLVRRIGVTGDNELTDVLRAFPKGFETAVYALRGVVPKKWYAGPRSIELEEPVG